jgi:hypothetical protein
MDVGELQYDFSLKSAQSVINSIFVIPGSMSLAVTDIADNGMSAYASLSAELSGSSFVEKSKDVTLRYQPHGSTASNTFTFRLQYNGLQYDARKGFMTLQLIPAQVKSEAYSTFFSNMTNGYWPFSGIAPSITLTNVKGGGSVVTNYESVTATQFIQKYLASLDPDAVKLELVSGYDVNILNQGTRFPSPGFAGILSRTGFAFSNLSPVTSQYDNDPVSAPLTHYDDAITERFRPYRHQPTVYLHPKQTVPLQNTTHKRRHPFRLHYTLVRYLVIPTHRPPAAIYLHPRHTASFIR